MRLLFIHQNLPGQFKHLLEFYGACPGFDVVGLGEARRVKANVFRPMPQGRLIGYEMPAEEASAGLPPLRTTEDAVRRAQAVLTVLLRLKQAGFYPDVVYAHPGWGETLFLKDVFPRSRLIHFCEFYYGTTGQDFSFDPEYPPSADDVLRLRLRNMHHLASLEHADQGISPTHWQKSVFPHAYHPRIEVIHDGVDTRALMPDEHAFIEFLDKGVRLDRHNEVLTFVSRNLEPYRGFHTFMRALPDLLRRRPHLHVVIVGADGVSYGRPAPAGTWRTHMLKEVGGALDMKRVHFTGPVSYPTYQKVLQVSTAHVYLTYPFVLSWSMMEAMAMGCLIIGSRTPCVEEVVIHGVNGLLVDFFSPDALADAVVEACAHRKRFDGLRHRARDTVISQYDLASVCLPRQREIIEGAGRPNAFASRAIHAQQG